MSLVLYLVLQLEMESVFFIADSPVHRHFARFFFELHSIFVFKFPHENVVGALVGFAVGYAVGCRSTHEFPIQMHCPLNFLPLQVSFFKLLHIEVAEASVGACVMDFV